VPAARKQKALGASPFTLAKEGEGAKVVSATPAETPLARLV